LASFEMNTNMN